MMNWFMAIVAKVVGRHFEGKQAAELPPEVSRSSVSVASDTGDPGVWVPDIQDGKGASHDNRDIYRRFTCLVFDLCEDQGEPPRRAPARDRKDNREGTC